MDFNTQNHTKKSILLYVDLKLKWKKFLFLKESLLAFWRDEPAARISLSKVC